VLAGRPGDVYTTKRAAERAVEAYEHLARHLARLLGETAVAMLVKRSIALASTEVPWMHAAVADLPALDGDGWLRLRGAMEHQEPEAINEAFVVLVSTLVGILNRLIGEGLVARLLAEVWPTVFAYAPKDSRD
jgi:hypothetical protein